MILLKFAHMPFRTFCFASESAVRIAYVSGCEHSHGTFPLLDNFPSFLHDVGRYPFHHNHPPIYGIKRSTVNVYTLHS